VVDVVARSRFFVEVLIIFFCIRGIYCLSHTILQSDPEDQNLNVATGILP